MPRQLELARGGLSDTLATNAASSATFAHHLHNSRSAVLPQERGSHLSDSSSYSDSSLGTAELSSSLSAASYGTPVAADVGRTIDSGSLSDDERTGPCGNGVPSPRSQHTMHTTDADAELTIQEEPTGDADDAGAIEGASSTVEGRGGANGSAMHGMVSQLSSVNASGDAPAETASGRVVWWENPLGGNSVSGPSEAGACSTAETTAVATGEPREANPVAPPVTQQPAQSPQEHVAAGLQCGGGHGQVRAAVGARPPLPPVSTPTMQVPDAAAQPQANLDSLLRTSMMHSSQLFGSGRGGQSGVHQSTVHLSTQDPVSALDMRMQHHEPISSAFPAEDSVLLLGGAARPHADPSGPTTELVQRRPVVSAMTADVTTGFTDPLAAIDVEMQHFAPTDELSQCMGVDSSTPLPAPVVPHTERSRTLPPPVHEERSRMLEDDDSLPLPPLMVVERKEQRAPARSGRITQFQSKRRLGAVAKAGCQARTRLHGPTAEPGQASKGHVVAATAKRSAATPQTDASADSGGTDSRELFASASSALSLELTPSRGLTFSPVRHISAPKRPEQAPERPTNPVDQLNGRRVQVEMRIAGVQQAGGALSSQASSGMSNLDDLTGDLMHPSCTYSLSVMNGSLSSLAGSSSLQDQSSGGARLEPGTPPRSREMQGGTRAAAQGISPLDVARDGGPSLRERFAVGAGCVSDMGANDGASCQMGFAGLPLGKEEELPPTPSMPGADSMAPRIGTDDSASGSCLRARHQSWRAEGPRHSDKGEGLRQQYSTKSTQERAQVCVPGAGHVLESPYSSFSIETDMESDNTNTWWSSIIEAAKVQDSATCA